MSKNLHGLWPDIRRQAKLACDQNKLIEPFLKDHILAFEDDQVAKALSHFVVDKIQLPQAMQEDFYQLFTKHLKQADLNHMLYHDIIAITKRDPACNNPLEALLFSKGLHALINHRVAHKLAKVQYQTALYLNYLSCIHFGVDIHPHAQIAAGLFIDHGDSLVIGETSVIDEDVSILQDVTLGGTGKDKGDRHPKIKKGVLIGAGAKILGNIKIGKYTKIGASSVVLEDVPPYSTAVGVPARVISRHPDRVPSEDMDHHLD